ncbi:hypothetical protein D9615_009154 [Tricholomella constricta]|uniref:Uncharacterized protein n=1 Tax=Tricholomella constricta TaxID=117010 RepID=A0A8H5LZX9_9AGAR|nr:hypothetical protein D9615_009154 [Tricholomella constricta]
MSFTLTPSKSKSRPMRRPEAFNLVPLSLIPTPTPTPQQETSVPHLLNIQFHIVSVHGLSTASASKLARSMIRRVVHATCTGAHHLHCQTDAVQEGEAWNENTEQMGPVVGTDKIKFRVEQHWALTRRATTIATSMAYTVESLRVMQQKQGDKKSISIPLSSNHDESVEATLLLRVQEPTTDFVSKRWQEEAEKLEQRRAAVEGKQPASR